MWDLQCQASDGASYNKSIHAGKSGKSGKSADMMILPLDTTVYGAADFVDRFPTQLKRTHHWRTLGPK